MTDVTGFQSRSAAGRDSYDFSVILGGPLFQMFRRAHLAGDALELLHRRIVVIAMFAWLPLLLLSILSGRAWGDAVRISFLKDIEVHLRFLLALPLVVVAELVVHQRMRPLARQFLDRGMISDAARPKFDAAVTSAFRLRNSVTAEVLLIVFVYVFTILYVWPQQAAAIGALNMTTWYALPAGGGADLSAAGWWLFFVGLPMFQFMLMRWYFRLAIWIRFLAAMARCAPRLVPTHPDRAGGLGFLSETAAAFAPLLMAHGVLLAGMIASRIFFRGATLPDFKAELIVVPVFLLLVVLGRSCCSCRIWPKRAVSACVSTAPWPSAMCASSTTSGSAGAHRLASLLWEAPTSSPWRTWAIASRLSEACARAPLPRTRWSSSR